MAGFPKLTASLDPFGSMFETVSSLTQRIKDKSLEDADSLPEPDVLAQEIADDLQAAMELFGAIANELKD